MEFNFPLFKYSIFIIGAVAILIGIYLQINVRNSVKIVPDNEYDYIIVGGGTVGCVLAARLSENPKNKVLLIEAGDYFGFASTVPLFSTLLQGSKNDWSFKSAPQEYSSFGLYNHSQSLPRGKGLGGSGMINYLIHGETVLDDFKNWNIPEWELSKILPYLKNEKPGSCHNNFETNDDFCPLKPEKVKPDLHLTDSNCLLTGYFKRAVQELNNPELTFLDTNVTVFEGQRWTTYHSYLKPAMERKNLHVVLNSRVVKVLFKNKVATGIEMLSHNKEKIIIHSKIDIILSAGALQSPQILLLSGIGPKEQLKKHGIKLIADLPGVGENLQDQLNMPMYISINSPLTVTVDKIISLKQFWDYLFYRKGLLSTTPIAGMMRGPNHTGLLLFAMGSTDEELLRDVANFPPETFRTLFPLYKNSSQEGFVFLPTCLQPKSRGSVYLKDSDPLNLPVVDPNYLSNSYDIGCIIQALKFAIDVTQSSVFQKMGAKIHWPLLRNCQHLPVEPLCEDYLECIIRNVALTAHHPAGTCKIGNRDDEMAVVDSLLKVKFVKGLRVMDASILPNPISTFPNDVLIQLAEYAAQLIIKSAR